MPMDAYRSGDEYVVQFDLPGVSPESIDLDVERNVLTVKAERKAEFGDEADVQIAERPRGVFSRQLFLGDTLDTDSISADYDAGVLTVRMPIADRAKPRKITIGGGAERNASKHLGGRGPSPSGVVNVVSTTAASPRGALEDADRLLEHVTRAIAEDAPDVARFRGAVEGVHRLVGTLTKLIETMMDRAPAAFVGDGHQHVGEELVRDLRAARGCLTTAGLLVEPAVDDLRALSPDGQR